MSGQYNLKNPAVKRLMKEAQELRESTEQYFAQPLDDNLFEWHFTIRGPVDSEFDGGIYHGRITLPPEYPMKPPSIMLLTPNGRFETFKKICLSISGHHPESWQPSWSIRTALLAIIGFMPTHGNGAIGSLDYTPEERKVLAKRSIEWKCPECGSTKTILKPVTEASKKTTEEAKELASQINFQGEKEKNATKKEAGDATTTKTKTAAEGTLPKPDIPGTVGSAGEPPASSAANTQFSPGLPPFAQTRFPLPNFPGGLPNAAMIQQRLMSPGGPMAAFVRPFWPGMPAVAGGAMPGMPLGVGGGGAMPPRPPGMMYPWPPMFNPMVMNPQMAAMMNQHRATLTTSTPVSTASTSPTTVTSSAETTPSPSPVSDAVTSPSSTSSTAQSSASSASSSPASMSPTEPATTDTRSTTVSPTPTSSPTPAVTTTTPTTGLRQRINPAIPRPVVVATYGNAELPTAQRGENPAVVLVMALLGLIIIALILRRLYNVINAGAFDTDF